MKKSACRMMTVLSMIAVLMSAPAASVYAAETDTAAETTTADTADTETAADTEEEDSRDLDEIMMEVAANAGDAEEVQQAAADAYSQSVESGNSAEVSSVIANQTIVNLAFLEADTDEERETALEAANALADAAQDAVSDTQTADTADTQSAAEAAEDSADTAKAAAAAAATESKSTTASATSSKATSVSASDRKLLAAIIYCEAGNQSMKGKIAVGNVVLNRVKSKKFPNTISKVIYQSGQFSPAGSGWLNRVLRSGNIPQSCYEAADRALAGERPVGNCIFFMRTYLHSSGIIIGAHCFWGSM